MWQRAANYNHRITLCKTVTACRGGRKKEIRGTNCEEGQDEWMERVKMQKEEEKEELTESLARIGDEKE